MGMQPVNLFGQFCCENASLSKAPDPVSRKVSPQILQPSFESSLVSWQTPGSPPRAAHPQRFFVEVFWQLIDLSFALPVDRVDRWIVGPPQ